MYALRLDEDGRILEVMDTRYQTKDTPMVEDYPRGEDVNLADYKYLDGEWVHAPIQTDSTPTLESRVGALEKAFESSILAMDAAYAEGVNSL